MTLSDKQWSRVKNAITRGEAAVAGLRSAAAKLRGIEHKLRKDGLDAAAVSVIAAASAIEIRADVLHAVLVELGSRTDPDLEDTIPGGIPLPKGDAR